MSSSLSVYRNGRRLVGFGEAAAPAYAPYPAPQPPTPVPIRTGLRPVAAAKPPAPKPIPSKPVIPLHAMLPPPKTGKVIARAQGVKHPTPTEALAAKRTAQAKAMLDIMLAKHSSWLRTHPRPSPTAQPSDIAAWLNAGGGSPRAAFPEWNWQVVHKAPVVHLLGLQMAIPGFEPGEATAAVQLGSHDSVIWYQHPNGAWKYEHRWGEDFGDVLSDIGHVMGQIASVATTVIDDAVKATQVVASFIPGVGQVVNGVIAAAETALDALSGATALQMALDSAYHAALAAVPGAQALSGALDPVIDALRRIAGGEKVSQAALQEILKEVPDAPKVGDLSPRSVAGSLASWLASKVGIA